MRLIDADALKDTVKKQICGECLDKKCERNVYCSDEMMMMLIDAMPTVDAVPVVRCKDCRWWCTDCMPEEFGWCDARMNKATDEDWFCADGERRDDA